MPGVDSRSPFLRRFGAVVLAALLDPEGDGHYVLNRIWKDSELDYRP